MKPELKLVSDTGSQLEESLLPELPPQQQEMPFAVVEGEPVTELPKDLYIPPDALRVFLEAFEGPLDLLLYLIRRQNLDILDIPIAEITRQYMQYIDVMADLQLELAGEYLLMAAMLAEIKSRMLLPRPPSTDGAEEDDPRAELVRRLQEYERFKKAAEDIDRLSRLERDTMPASAELVERKVVKALPQVTLQEMLLAFKDVLSRAEMFAHHHVNRERLSVRQRMSDILTTLREAAFMEFSQLFRAQEGRMGVTVTFIAILELMKEGLIEIVQSEVYAPIHVRPSAGSRRLTVVEGGIAQADAENEAALAQPELPGENELEDEGDDAGAGEGILEAHAEPAPNHEPASDGERASDNEQVSDAAQISTQISALDSGAPGDETSDTVADMSDPIPDTLSTIEDSVRPAGDAEQNLPQQPRQSARMDSEQIDSEQTDSEQTDSGRIDSEQTDSQPTNSQPTDSEPTDSEPTDSEPTEGDSSDDSAGTSERQTRD